MQHRRIRHFALGRADDRPRQKDVGVACVLVRHDHVTADRIEKAARSPGNQVMLPADLRPAAFGPRKQNDHCREGARDRPVGAPRAAGAGCTRPPDLRIRRIAGHAGKDPCRQAKALCPGRKPGEQGRHRPGRAAGRAAQGTCARARQRPAPHPACRSVIPEAYHPAGARKSGLALQLRSCARPGLWRGHLKLRHDQEPGRSLPGAVKSGGPAGAHGRAGPRLDHRHMSLRRPAERRLKPGMPGHVHVDISGESFFDAGTEQRISR